MWVDAFITLTLYVSSRCSPHLCAVPAAAPENVQAIVLNSTVAEVHWDPVPSKLIRGHLKGYKVQNKRLQALRHKHLHQQT